MRKIRNPQSAIRNFKIGKRGQSALIDALIFMAILLVAAALLQLYSAHGHEEVSTRSYIMDYTTAALDAALKSTVNLSWYKDRNGHTIYLDDLSVQELVIEDLELRNSRKANKTSLVAGIESQINATVRAVAHPAYSYRLVAQYRNVSLVVTDFYYAELPPEHYASTVSLQMPNHTEFATVTLYIFKI